MQQKFETVLKAVWVKQWLLYVYVIVNSARVLAIVYKFKWIDGILSPEKAFGIFPNTFHKNISWI